VAKSVSLILKGYYRGRVAELARPETRAASEPLAEWAVRRIRLDGKPFSFEGHAYQRAIYDDASPHVVLMKAAQIGGTVWAVLRSLHACLSGLNVIYLFPTRTDVLEFSKSRVGPLIEDNAFLTKSVRDTDTAGLKRIGAGYMYLRGMQSAVGLKSVPADMLVFDELDEATPDAKTRAKERLSHSDYRRVIELSNPSLPGYGIDEAFQLSDQRHWTLRCEACREWTAPALAFPMKLGDEVRIIRPRGDGTHFLACVRCGHELDPEAGEWVAMFPDRPTHGYRISQLFSTKIDPGEILQEYERTRFPDRFYNLKIGVPWADTANRVDAQTVLARCGDAPMLEKADNYTSCTMGVDTGRELHVVISRRLGQKGSFPRQVVFIGVRHEYHELDELMKRYKVGTCVIDALPEIHATRDFTSRHRGKVWMNYFNETQRGEPKWDSTQQIVQENRTEALDTSRAVIRNSTVTLPRRTPIVEQFAQHMAADAKRLEEDEDTGAQSYRYIRTGPDHFSLAFTYDCIAAQRDYSVGHAYVSTEPFDDPILGRWEDRMDIFSMRN
jgi:hypothetical protein